MSNMIYSTASASLSGNLTIESVRAVSFPPFDAVALHICLSAGRTVSFFGTKAELEALSGAIADAVANIVYRHEVPRMITEPYVPAEPAGVTP